MTENRQDRYEILRRLALMGTDGESLEQAAQSALEQPATLLGLTAVAMYLWDDQMKVTLSVTTATEDRDKERLLGITKRGDKYTRTQVINGARAVVIHAKGKPDNLSRWITRLVQKRGFNKAVVALANKLVRMAWVIIARGERYRPWEVRVTDTAIVV